METMKMKISKEKFGSLKGLELLQALAQIPIDQIRGKGENRKKEVYDRLTSNQQSLLSFWVMYGHTRSGWLQFYLEGLSIGGYDHYLPAIKEGLKRINDQKMLRIVTQSEKLYIRKKELLISVWGYIEKRKKLEQETQVAFDIITQEFDEIDQSFFPILERTIQKMESYIMTNLQEFVAFTT